jgi:NADH dehydrogenase FAD-containing subunit
MGCKTNTFGTPGVAEREGQDVFFLKHLSHARQIRQRTLECFERACTPGISEAERDSLLSFVVVGGGPTSCEFVTELHDFLRVSYKKNRACDIQSQSYSRQLGPRFSHALHVTHRWTWPAGTPI